MCRVAVPVRARIWAGSLQIVTMRLCCKWSSKRHEVTLIWKGGGVSYVIVDGRDTS